ncbi:hypothetical protein [Luteococcus sanguinis]|uniref:Cobalamin-independent methionine synthase MetE C-terminal/archaeal domain-containing protein n=1 Tax=Luteococcus sanguinis TaxID=174038 RepID=A0ABW1X537_9ACTN
MRATGLGSLPGTDMPAALGMALGTGSPWLPELPARGPGAGMIGRTTAVLEGLGADLQPQGWRLIDGSGADHARARSTLRHDLDDLEEAAQGHAGPVRVTMSGPWTMAACVERPRGDRVLADHGLRRELAESLGIGFADLLAELGRRLPEVSFTAQLDEPSLPAVLAGRVPTASGFSRHRSVDVPMAVDLLARVVQPVKAVVDEVTMHCCAPGLDLDVPDKAGVHVLALPTANLSAAQWDQLGPWLESGRRLALGVADTPVPDQLPGADAVVARVLRIARPLGLDPAVWVEKVDLSPDCGLAGWSELGAGRLLEQLERAAELLPEQLTRCQPG